MIVCRNCGEHNEQGTQFCIECNAFLEWEGEAVEEEVPWWQQGQESEEEQRKRRWWRRDGPKE